MLSIKYHSLGRNYLSVQECFSSWTPSRRGETELLQSWVTSYGCDQTYKFSVFLIAACIFFFQMWLLGNCPMWNELCFFLIAFKTWKVKERKKVKSLSHAWLFVTPWTVACTKLLRPWDFQRKSTGVDWTQVSRIVDRQFTIWATREVLKTWRNLTMFRHLWKFLRSQGKWLNLLGKDGLICFSWFLLFLSFA